MILVQIVNSIGLLYFLDCILCNLLKCAHPGSIPEEHEHANACTPQKWSIKLSEHTPVVVQALGHDQHVVPEHTLYLVDYFVLSPPLVHQGLD